MYLLWDNTIIVEVLPIFYIDRSSCRAEERSFHGKKGDISIVDLSPLDLTEEELRNVRNALLEALEESYGMPQENGS